MNNNLLHYVGNRHACSLHKFIICFIGFLAVVAVTCQFIPSVYSQSEKALASLYSNYLKGLVAAEKGDFSLSLEQLEKVKEKDPDSVHINLKLATILIRLGKVDQAQELLKAAKKDHPDNLDVSLALIFVYSYAQDDVALESEYETFLRNAHKAKPKNVGISEYLAQFYFYKKKPKEAIEVYEKIITINPKYVPAMFWLGYLYQDVGRPTEALSIWHKGLEMEPTYAPILNSLGYTYAQANIKLDDAEKMVLAALNEEPDNGAYLDSLGWIYFKKGDLEKAALYLRKAIEQIKDPEIYEHLGDLYIEFKDRPKALDFYREGLTHFPNSRNLQAKINKYEKQD